LPGFEVVFLGTAVALVLARII